MGSNRSEDEKGRNHSGDDTSRDQGQNEELAVRKVDGKYSIRALTGKYSVSGVDLKVYNTVSGEEIPEDEPLFLLRARDHVALFVLEEYLRYCSRDVCIKLHIDGIIQSINKFEKFRKKHPERMKQPGVTGHLKLEAE